jgi:MFS family permease
MSVMPQRSEPRLWSLSFVSLLAAQFISLLGTQMSLVAIPWFVLVTTGSPARMVTVLLAETLTMALSGILAGPLVDRFDRKRLMVALDLARGLTILLIPTLALLGQLRFWMIVLVSTVGGLLAMPYVSARTAHLPAVVGEDEQKLTFANSLLQFTMQTTAIVGPALAGVLVGLLGNLNVVFLDGLSYIVAAATVAGLVHARAQTTPKEQRSSWAEDLREGLAFLWGRPLLRAAIPVATLVQLAIGVLLQAALPVYVREVLRGDARSVGLLLSAFGAGSTMGMLLYGGMAARWPWRRGVTVLTSLAGAASALLLLPLAHTRTAALIGLGLGGLLSGPGSIIVHTLLQTETPGELRGRVISAFFTLWLLATPAGLALAGPALERWGAVPVLWALVALLGATAAGGWFSPAIRNG